MSSKVSEAISQEIISPFAKYAEYYAENKLGERDSVYLSHAVTSGGYYRMRDTITREEYIQRNCDLVKEFVNVLKQTDHITGNIFSILPAEIFVMGWHDFDYMTFFHQCILGIDTAFVFQLQEYMSKRFSSDQQKLMNDKTLESEMRLPVYLQHADIILDFVKEFSVSCRPVNSIVRLLDNDTSIGSRAESYLGSKMSVPIHEFRITDIMHPHLEPVRDAVLELHNAGMKIFHQAPDHIHPVILLPAETHNIG